MKRTRVLVPLIAAIAIAGGPARAHERGGNAVGIVRDVSVQRLVIETPDGHRVAFSVTKDTRFTRGGAAARLEDVKPGERAAVHGERHGDTLDAVLVKLGAARSKASAAHGD